MITHHILNPELNKALASMGHGDLLMVTDAGFPIPKDAWKVDLAIARDLPDVHHVLDAIMSEFCVEKIIYGNEVCEFNPGLHSELKRIFSNVPHEYIPHAELMGDMRNEVKVFVRTGGFNAWGNILLQSLPHVPEWFEREGTIVPPWYQEAAAKS